MRFGIQAALMLLMAVSVCVAEQPQGSGKKTAESSGFDWLKQFEGNWSVSSFPQGSSKEIKSTITSRVVGSNWIVNEHNTADSGFAYTAIQTIGYDTEKKQFHGNWIDSMMSFKWEYVGKLDESGKKLQLDADGPDMSNPKKMRKYRDVYEIKSPTEIAGLSQLLNDDGKWETFNTITMSKQADSKEVDSLAAGKV